MEPAERTRGHARRKPEQGTGKRRTGVKIKLEVICAKLAEIGKGPMKYHPLPAWYINGIWQTGL